LYYILSRQWRKLAEIRFNKIILSTSGKRIIVNREDLSRENRSRVNRKSRISDHYFNLIRDMTLDELDFFITSPFSSRAITETLPSLRGLHPSALRGLRQYARDFMYRDRDGAVDDGGNLARVDSYIQDNISGQILYLPTYRRIEKDIKTIFPEIEEEIQQALYRRNRRREEVEVFVELVNFGMEDVKRQLAAKLEQLRSQALAEVGGLQLATCVTLFVVKRTHMAMIWPSDLMTTR
jgi:hypothetical protein